MANICPLPGCGARLEATKKIYYYLDDEGHLVVVDDYDNDWHVYCGNDHEHGEFPGFEEDAAKIMRAIANGTAFDEDD